MTPDTWRNMQRSKMLWDNVKKGYIYVVLPNEQDTLSHHETFGGKLILHLHGGDDVVIESIPGVHVLSRNAGASCDVCLANCIILSALISQICRLHIGVFHEASDLWIHH